MSGRSELSGLGLSGNSSKVEKTPSAGFVRYGLADIYRIYLGVGNLPRQSPLVRLRIPTVGEPELCST